MMSRSTEPLDYFYCFPPPDEPPMFTGWIDLSLLPDTATVLYYIIPLEWPPSRSWLPSPRAYAGLVRGGIPQSFDDIPDFDESSFSVIIDSTASLEISSCTSDFIGEIKKVDLQLGGMANGMRIEGRVK